MLKTCLRLAAAACFAFISIAPANAQATRTWVSGLGDDVNPCSRTAPCKTFAGAISKTAPGGEINCLDPGGFGAVTIIKSITIDCSFTEGGVLAGGNGITVNAAATDTIVLRGLDIFGVNPPTNGVRVVQAGTVVIEDSTIRRFNAANSQGVSFQPTNLNARLFIVNTTISSNGNGATGGGILISPTATGSAVVSLRKVRVVGNANNGIRIDSIGNTGSRFTIMLDDVEIAGNAANGVVATAPVPNTPVSVLINDSTIVGNATGIRTDGGLATVRVTGTNILGNTLGLAAVNSSAIFSYGDNILDANPDNINPNNGAFTGAVLPKR